ncbi:MAG: T9SS type A sorting domain-containing protein, partial [Saprospiraceae bacterium]|nr:T9SS type A sorting domain-containing protein [Saprospiraceae bacterium]
AADATISISDVTGKTIKLIRGSYAKGYNQITLNRSELPTGVLTYTLESGEFTATKKMVVVE